MKKLEKWKQRIRNLPRYSDLSYFLRKSGFRKLGYTDVYINKQESVVIKLPWITSRRPAKIAVPTVTVQKNGECWYIQPLCKKFNLKSKLKYVAVMCYLYPDSDLHKGNLGLYRNKVVAFDW